MNIYIVRNLSAPINLGEFLFSCSLNSIHSSVYSSFMNLSVSHQYAPLTLDYILRSHKTFGLDYYLNSIVTPAINSLSFLYTYLLEIIEPFSDSDTLSNPSLVLKMKDAE